MFPLSRPSKLCGDVAVAKDVEGRKLDSQSEGQGIVLEFEAGFVSKQEVLCGRPEQNLQTWVSCLTA